MWPGCHNPHDKALPKTLGLKKCIMAQYKKKQGVFFFFLIRRRNKGWLNEKQDIIHWFPPIAVIHFKFSSLCFFFLNFCLARVGWRRRKRLQPIRNEPQFFFPFHWAICFFFGSNWAIWWLYGSNLNNHLNLYKMQVFLDTNLDLEKTL